jgi:hypothetical protein
LHIIFFYVFICFDKSLHILKKTINLDSEHGTQDIQTGFQKLKKVFFGVALQGQIDFLLQLYVRLRPRPTLTALPLLAAENIIGVVLPAIFPLFELSDLASSLAPRLFLSRGLCLRRNFFRPITSAFFGT